MKAALPKGRAIGLLATSAILWPLGALAGEGPSLYARGRWQDGQKAAAGSKLVVVAKVVEAGKPKGSGWDGNFQRDSADYKSWTGEVKIEQRVVVEVSEVLRGQLKGKKLAVNLGAARLSYQDLRTHWSRHFRKGARAAVQGIPVIAFALRKGKSYLLFLDAPKTPKAGGGEKAPSPTANHLAGYSPSESGDATMFKSVRAFCAALFAWQNPPALGAAEAAAVRKLIAQLGDEAYDKRVAADKALRAMALRVAPRLIAASRDKDIERATAARKIIEDFRPKPGKTQHPKVEKPPAKPEKPKPAGGAGKPGPATSDG